MAFPSTTSPTVTQFASSVTSMTVNLPASINSGDLLLAVVEVRNSGTWTVPTDWVEFKAQLGGGSVGELTAFYKIASGSEGSTAGWTAGTATTAIWHVRKITSWHGTTPPEASSTSGDASAANPTSLSPSWGSADTLWISVAGHTASSTSAWSAGPSGYSDFLCSGASSGGAAVSIASAYLQNAAASEDPGAFTVSGSNRWWAAMNIGIRPAAGGTNVTVTGTVQTVTSVVNSPSELLGATMSPSVQSLTSSIETYTQKHGSTLSPSEQVLNSVLNSPTIIEGIGVSNSPVTQTVALSTQTLTIGEGVGDTIAASVQAITATHPGNTVLFGSTITPNAQSLTLSVPTYTVFSGIIVAVNSQNLSVSLPTNTISFGSTVSVDVQELSLSNPGNTVLLGATITVSVQDITITIPTYAIIVPTIGVSSQNLSLSLPTPTVATQIGIVVSPAVQSIIASIPQFAVLVWQPFDPTSSLWTTEVPDSANYSGETPTSTVFIDQTPGNTSWS